MSKNSARQQKNNYEGGRVRKTTQPFFNGHSNPDSNESLDSALDKKWVKHKEWQPPCEGFKPLTDNHIQLIEALKEYPRIIINGPPGCLKTFLSLKISLELIKAHSFERMLYIRQDIERPNERRRGELPGTEEEKLSPLLAPIMDNLEALVNPGEMSYLLRTKIKASRVDSLRGRSPLKNILLVDEAQNCDVNALECLMTRKTTNSKLIITGDFKHQRDMISRDFDAFELVCREFSKPSYADTTKVITLTENDIVRDQDTRFIIKGFDNIRRQLQNRSIRNNPAE